jgi:PhzF family phenazine biosynthesis protein
MRQRSFSQVDVFTATPYKGNPVAVVQDGEGLTDAQMQAFARWTNLSETTFLLPPTHPEADYRLRIFTPGGELPFAGHPTLGSCYAWLQAGGKSRSSETVVQQCEAGLVPVKRQGNGLSFAAPPLTRQDVEVSYLAQVVSALGLSSAQVQRSQSLDNGPVWLSLWLDHADTVLSLTPDHRQLKALGAKVGVAGPYVATDNEVLIARSSREARAFATGRPVDASLNDAPATIEVRAFAAPFGIEEDPVTGSLNASLAQWLMADGILPEDYTAAQGTLLGREGRVSLHRDAQGQVWVGGQVQPCVTGLVLL